LKLIAKRAKENTAWARSLRDFEPIRNPVTGEEHRAQISLPDGFEFKLAEIGNSVEWRMSAQAPLLIQHNDTYAQLNYFDWSNL
jgi:hypothetical protein